MNERADRRPHRKGPARPPGPGHRPRTPPHRGASGGDRDGPVVLYGWHTVSAALANPARRIRRLSTTENAARRLAEEAIALPPAHEIVRPDAIAARLAPDAVHQGLLAEADPLEGPAIEDLHDGIVLVLDQITDPHNVGAIVRTAAAFAVAAIVTTTRHSPEATGALAKSASGGLEARAAGDRDQPRARTGDARQNAASCSSGSTARRQRISDHCRCGRRSHSCSAPKARACAS